MRCVRRGELTEAHEKICDVHYVCWVSSSVVIHFVLFPRLVLYEIQENVDRRFAVLGHRAVPDTKKHPRWDPRNMIKWEDCAQVKGYRLRLRNVLAGPCAEYLGGLLTVLGLGELRILQLGH